jgi:hypothetical protein
MAARSPRLRAPGANMMMIVLTIIARVHGHVSYLANEPNTATEQTRIDTLPETCTDTAGTAARCGSSTAPASPVVHVQTKDTVYLVLPAIYMMTTIGILVSACMIKYKRATAGSYDCPLWDKLG